MYLPKQNEEPGGIQLLSLNIKKKRELFHLSNSSSNTGIGTNTCELAETKFRLDIERRL